MSPSVNGAVNEWVREVCGRRTSLSGAVRCAYDSRDLDAYGLAFRGTRRHLGHRCTLQIDESSRPLGGTDLGGRRHQQVRDHRLE